MIRPSLFFSLLSLLPFGCLAQINVQGRVMDMNDCEPLAGASVVIKGSDGKIKKFTSTKADGDFLIEMASVDGYHLEITMMSFEKKSISCEAAQTSTAHSVAMNHT